MRRSATLLLLAVTGCGPYGQSPDLSQSAVDAAVLDVFAVDSAAAGTDGAADATVGDDVAGDATSIIADGSLPDAPATDRLVVVDAVVDPDASAVTDTGLALDVSANPGVFVLQHASYQVTENAGQLEIVVQRENGLHGEVAVSYSTKRLGGGVSPFAQDGDFVAPGDYDGHYAALTFAAGVAQQSFSISIVDDSVVEGPETFEVYLLEPSGGAQLGAAERILATVTIVDNDSAAFDASAGPDVPIVDANTASLDAAVNPTDAAVSNPEELPSTQHNYLGAIEDRDLISDLIEDHWQQSEPTRIIYVAPPSGSIDGTGTREDPRRDLKAALEAAEPGDHFYLAPGEYPMSTVRDTFGHPGSLVFLNAHGTPTEKIVVRTDPSLYNPQTGRVAQIDFAFENRWPNHRTFAFFLSGRHWILRALEIRNVHKNGIWVTGKYNVIRDCELHHANHDGTNNFGLIVMATGGPSYNLVMGNHIHHAAVLDSAGDVIDYGGSQGGCTFSETRQGYDSDFSGLGDDPSRAQIDATKLPPDSEVYYYNNLVHHCHNGIATKNNTEGPFYILSNVIHDVENGVKITLAHSVVRNNIIYRGGKLGSGILTGWSATGGTVSILYHGVNLRIKNNTIVDANRAMSHYTGWNLSLTENLVVDASTAHKMLRNPYRWYPRTWPGVVGEWAYADLTSDHPYYSFMPRCLQEMAGEYHRVSASGNVYQAPPALVMSVESEFYNLGGTYFSEDYSIIESAILRAHMRDAGGNDYRRDPDNPGPLLHAGSKMR